MINPGLLSSLSQDWETPREEFAAWNKIYDFTFDPCCDLDSCKCPEGIFYDLGQDGLVEPWRGRVFMNPPYNALRAWVEKAAHEARHNNAVEFVVGLLPARTDTRAFHNHIWDHDLGVPRPGVKIDFLPGRLAFGSDKYWSSVWEAEYIKNSKGQRVKNSLYKKYGKKNPAPFPSMLITWEFKK